MKGSFSTAIIMNKNKCIHIFKRFFVGILVFLIFFSALIGPEAVYAKENSESNYAEILQGIEGLIERVRALEKDNLKLKQDNVRLMKIIEQGIAKQVPVLLYHHLYDGDLKTSPYNGNGVVISVDSFKEQMKYLKDNGYYTATLEELERFIAKEIDLPKKTVVITFDDGYYSNIEYAYPILKKHGQRATIFVIGKNVEDVTKGTLSPTKLKGVGYEDIKNTSDVFEFHSHTYNLHNYTGDEPSLTVLSKEDIVEDISKIREDLGTDYLAYPFGGYNDTTIEALIEAGYKLGFTVKEGYVSPNTEKYEIPRLSIWPWTSIGRFKQIVAPR